MAGCRAGLAGLVVFGALACACHSPQRPASHTTSTTTVPNRSTTATPSTASAPPAANIQPLPVRPVQKSQPTTAGRCPATNPTVPVAPAGVLVTCDLAQATLYTLGPETMQLVLTQVDPPKLLTSDIYVINLTLDPNSAGAWASFTAAHVHDHVAFIRDGLVLEAPIIEEPVTSGQIALTTETRQAADQLAQLAGRPV